MTPAHDGLHRNFEAWVERLQTDKQPWTPSYGSSQLLVKTEKSVLEAVAILMETIT